MGQTVILIHTNKLFPVISNIEIDRRKSAELTRKIYNVFDNVFNGIGCFEGTFLLQLKPITSPIKHHQGV